MKKIIFMIIMSFMLTGCSLLPRLTFDTKGAIPQQTDKSTMKDTCKGEAKFNEVGEIIYCSKGYMAYSKNYAKKERKMTIIEKIKSFINSLVGWGFWGFIAIAIFFPGLIGSLLTFFLSASRRVARETISAIKRFRRESAPDVKESLDNYLRNEQSKETKKYISNIRKNE